MFGWAVMMRTMGFVTAGLLLWCSTCWTAQAQLTTTVSEPIVACVRQYLRRLSTCLLSVLYLCATGLLTFSLFCGLCMTQGGLVFGSTLPPLTTAPFVSTADVVRLTRLPWMHVQFAEQTTFLCIVGSIRLLTRIRVVDTLR